MAPMEEVGLARYTAAAVVVVVAVVVAEKRSQRAVGNYPTNKYRE